MTGIIIFTDMFLGRVEFVFSHLLINLPLALLYIILNGAYVAAGGAPLYQLLQWNSWISYAVAVGCLALIACVLWPLGHLYTRMRNRCSGNKSPVPQGSRFIACSV